MKAAVKAADGSDWEMLAPTNDRCVIRYAKSKAHKWNILVTANRDELKIITTKYYEYFYSECRGMLQYPLMGSITNDILYIHHGLDAITHDGELTDQVLALPIASSSLLGTPAPPWSGPHPAEAGQ
jgi:hypothetical protein